MLVLSRKIGERITIGEDILITITQVAGGRVSIGIDAPKHVTVRRNELESRLLDCQTERFAVENSSGSRQDFRFPQVTKLLTLFRYLSHTIDVPRRRTNY